MATILSTSVIEGTKTEIATYRDQAQTMVDELKGVIDTLIQNNFIGDGSAGYNTFFTTRIIPMLTDNLTGSDSLMAGLERLIDDIGNQLIGTTDPQIGEYNTDPGSAKG